ncbi:MAG: SIMPL domain-containing protein [Pseudomonadales bacterium]|nr:SIMPL domain-containing protein [Candidatus Woesebacteria bacterium]MCB9801983.1 SIMPL domain-containing protein [Pseudomonadales bacterium]
MKQNLITLFVFSLVVLALLALFPWKDINWGSINIQPAETITVSGYATSMEETQIAHFSAGAEASGSDPQALRNQVDSIIAATVQQLLDLGISRNDIQTQSTSLYEEPADAGQPITLEYRVDPDGNAIPPEGVESGSGQWRASNTISITLRDISKADKVLSILSTGDLTNVYGPNFMLDDTIAAQEELLAQAVANARQKADTLAMAADKQVVEVVSISEGGFVGGYMPMMLESAATTDAIMPGTEQVSQSVTVVFAIR